MDLDRKRSETAQFTKPRTNKRSSEATMKKETLLKSKEVAHILDCCPDDVIDLARKEKLRAIKQGRFWRFRQADVMTYKKKLERRKP
jgi:excisionase family DNA binding protein